MRRTRSAELPVRVQAFALAAGAVTVARLGHVPVLAALWNVAVLAESRIVIALGRLDLGEAEGGPGRLGDPLGAAGTDGVAVAVAGGNALRQQIPLTRLASPQDTAVRGAASAPTRRARVRGPRARCGPGG
jgi:hypothetical protein